MHSAMKGGGRGAQGGAVCAPTHLPARAERWDSLGPFGAFRKSSVDSVSTQRYGLTGGTPRTIRSLQRLPFCMGSATRRLRLLPIGEASDAVHRTSPFTHSRKFPPTLGLPMGKQGATSCELTPTQPLNGSYGETRASPSSLQNQTYPPPAASAPGASLARGPISSEATTCIVWGSTRTSRYSLAWTIAHTPPP